MIKIIRGIMFSSNNKISARQFQILFILTLFSSANLTLPRITSDLAKQNGWILIIGGAILAILYVVIITKLGRMFPDESFVQYAAKIVTKPIGAILSIILLIDLIIFASLHLRIFSELIKQTLLTRTPIEIIIMVMLVVVAYLTRKGVEVRGRIGEIIIFLSFIPIVIVLLIAAGEINLSNLAPFFTAKAKDIGRGSFYVSHLFTGIQLLLITIPTLKQPQKATKVAIESIVFVALLFLVVNLVTVGIFGYQETSRQIWPVMTIMQTTEIPGAFIERQDALMVSFWILMVFILIAMFMSSSTKLLQELIRSNKDHYLALVMMPFFYIGALIPDNVPQTFEYLNWCMKHLCMLFYLPIPLLLLAIAKIRGLGTQHEK